MATKEVVLFCTVLCTVIPCVQCTIYPCKVSYIIPVQCTVIYCAVHCCRPYSQHTVVNCTRTAYSNFSVHGTFVILLRVQCNSLYITLLSLRQYSLIPVLVIPSSVYCYPMCTALLSTVSCIVMSCTGKYTAPYCTGDGSAL